MDLPKFVVTIIERLHDAGYQAYIVGGSVRDIYLGRPVMDWDVTTSAPYEQIKAIFRDIKHFSLKHDTVTLIDSARLYEITPFRGSKNVDFTVEEDLGHRDFTINAMAYDMGEKAILDPYGGRKDIVRRLIRAVGEPKDRFREDPLRLLRAIRMATELGFRIEPKTLEAISIMSGDLVSVPQERIREELSKVLLSQRPSVGFNLMVRTGLLRHFLPELLEGYRRRQNGHHRYTIFKHIMETIDRVERDLVLRLTGLLHDIAKPRVRQKIRGQWRFLGHEKASARLAREIMGRLRFSNETIDRVTNLIAHHMIGYQPKWSNGAVRRLIQRVGSENMDDLLSFRKADVSAHGLINQKMDLLLELERRVEALRKRPLVTNVRDLHIDGHRVMEILGLSPGPEVGKILKELVEKVTDQPELNTEERIVAVLREMKRGSKS